MAKKVFYRVFSNEGGWNEKDDIYFSDYSLVLDFFNTIGTEFSIGKNFLVYRSGLPTEEEINSQRPKDKIQIFVSGGQITFRSFRFYVTSCSFEA